MKFCFDVNGEKHLIFKIYLAQEPGNKISENNCGVGFFIIPRTANSSFLKEILFIVYVVRQKEIRMKTAEAV